MKRRWLFVGALVCMLTAVSAAVGASSYATWMRQYTQEAQKQAEHVSLEQLGLSLNAEQEEIFRLGVAHGYDLRADNADDPQETVVWIPVNGGKKYHRYADCSKMKNPKQVSISEAVRLNYTPCGRCKPPEQ